MLLFLCVFKKNETRRPPPAPTSENYDKTPLANGPTHPQTTTPTLLALFVLLGFRLGIRARVVIPHAAWVVASAMTRAEARTGVRTTRRAAVDLQRECYVSSDANGGASGGVVGGARCGACARQRAAEQEAQKKTPSERTANCDNKGKRTSRRLTARCRARRVALGVRPRVRT